MQNYWRSYGFTRDPFNPGSEPFYTPKSWDDYLDMLPQFSRFCNTLLIIVGNEGVGKTTLLEVFLEEEGRAENTIFLTAGECPGVEYLLKLLAEKFSAPYNPASSLPVSEQLEEQLNYLKLHKESRLLVIDDAENLPLDMRQACLQIIQQQNALETCLPVILAGSPQLREQFNALLTSKTAEECLHIIELNPLTLPETRDYIYQTCEAASSKPFVFPFTDLDIDMIYEKSQGVIARINETAQEILQSKEPAGFDWRQLLRGKLLWWSIIIVVIAAMLFVYRSMNQNQQMLGMTTPAAMHSSDDSTAEQSNAAQSATGDTNNTPKNADYQTGDMVVKSNSQTATSATASTTPATSTPATAIAPTTAAENSTSAPITPAPASPAPVATDSANEVVTPYAPDAEETPPASLTATSGGGAPGEIAAVAPPVKHIKHKPKASSAAAGKSYFNSVMAKKMAIQKKQILQVNPRFFTIQFLSSNNLHTIAKFIGDHQLQATAKVVPVKHGNQDWYIVIYGAFQNSVAAKQAITKLAPNLQKLKPWVRTYQSVHTVMKK